MKSIFRNLIGLLFIVIFLSACVFPSPEKIEPTQTVPTQPFCAHYSSLF